MATFTKILTPTDITRDANIPKLMFETILHPHLPQYEALTFGSPPIFFDVPARDTQRLTQYQLRLRLRFHVRIVRDGHAVSEFLWNEGDWRAFVQARDLRVGTAVKFSWNVDHNRLDMRVIDNWSPAGQLRGVRVPTQPRPSHGWGLPPVDGTLAGALVLVFMRSQEVPQQQQEEQQRDHHIEGRLYLVRLENGQISYTDLGDDASLVEIRSWSDNSDSSGVFVEKYNGEAGMLRPVLQEFLPPQPQGAAVFSRKCNVNRDIIGLDGIVVVGRFHENTSSSIMEYLRSCISEDGMKAGYGAFGEEAILSSDVGGSSSSSADKGKGKGKRR